MIAKVMKSLVMLLLAVCLNRCSIEPESNEPVIISWQAKWLQRNVVRVSSVGPGNEDFSDLETLKATIGDAQLVMLGEQTHGDGTTFLAKVRLIKFLHREMGFDVVAFESGLYDCHKVWTDIEAGEDAVTAARRGIYMLWSNCQEVRPLFEYISQLAAEGQVLEIAGFDCNVSGNARDYLVADLEVFLRHHNVQVLNDPDWLSFREDLQNFQNDRAYTPSPKRRTTFFRILDSAWQEMDTLAARQRPLLQSPAFWKQLLSSIRQQAHRYWIIQDDNLRGNARDAQMAENLIWLLQNPYRNRKVVAWAATFHIIRNFNEIIDPLEPDLDHSKWVPMGHHLWQEMGDSLYSIGFTAYQGTFRSISQNEVVEIEPSSTDSIEYLMNEAGIEVGMIDISHLPDDGAWLREPLLSRPMGYQEMRSNWNRNLDALFFIKETRHSNFDN